MDIAHLCTDGAPVEHYPDYRDPGAAYDRERQDELDNRLTAQECDLLSGLLNTFALELLGRIRAGGLTELGVAEYRREIRLAEQTRVKLLGRVAP